MALSSVLSLDIYSQSSLTWIILSPILLLILRSIYRISPLHPLYSIPGPPLPRLTSLYLTRQAYLGTECTTIHALHRKYGPIVRTGPNSVDITDGAALAPIYATSGGFRKPAFYGNFDIDGHKSIFSEIDPKVRAVRAKAVTPLFASAGLRAGEELLGKIVGGLVSRVGAVRRGQGVNLLDLTRGLAVDVVTGYLFGRAYGGLTGVGGKGDGIAREVEMSANGMVDIFVAVGRFWYLPSWAFQLTEWYDGKFGEGSNPQVGESLQIVDRYITGVVKDAVSALETGKTVGGVSTTSYPARLLAAGISESETRAQCKDLIFAGTDSTGMNLATIMFYLAKHPDIYSKLKAEVCSEQYKDISDPLEIQSLPYLRGVVREGLRLSMANPSRLPRVVPDSGWTFDGYTFPAGTVVSCTPFELHFNPEAFPSPDMFKPERWIDSTAQQLELMNRDAIPFGLGPRQCIARNLATVELYLATRALAMNDCLAGASCVGEKIEIIEWFNSHVIGGKIELVWR